MQEALEERFVRIYGDAGIIERFDLGTLAGCTPCGCDRTLRMPASSDVSIADIDDFAHAGGQNGLPHSGQIRGHHRCAAEHGFDLHQTERFGRIDAGHQQCIERAVKRRELTRRQRADKRPMLAQRFNRRSQSGTVGIFADDGFIGSGEEDSQIGKVANQQRARPRSRTRCLSRSQISMRTRARVHPPEHVAAEMRRPRRPKEPA